MSDFEMSPIVTVYDDGTLAFEWIGKTMWTALFVESNPGDSSWHYVSKHGERHSEELAAANMAKLIECIRATASDARRAEGGDPARGRAMTYPRGERR